MISRTVAGPPPRRARGVNLIVIADDLGSGSLLADFGTRERVTGSRFL